MRRFMPAGILEFCADPRSPYHKNVFAKFGNLILFCGGSWRSTLTAETRQVLLKKIDSKTSQLANLEVMIIIGVIFIIPFYSYLRSSCHI